MILLYKWKKEIGEIIDPCGTALLRRNSPKIGTPNAIFSSGVECVPGK